MENRTLVNFVIKWVLNGIVVTLLLLYFANVTFWPAALAATILTIIAYFVGDQLILRNTNNTVATIADGILTFLYLYLIEMVYSWGLSVGEILVISVVVAICEAVLHRLVFQERAV
ncbi:DUF2512 family protein [Paenibacillus sp. GYB003]|uniref:DUF2512 family protein n=1 Tax=Paenibacillus sp. GYB003 TaxID=2994392 RepID=UPI002F96CB14